MGEPRVSILMGSTSDKEVMDEAKSVLKKFGIDYEVKVLSAHRTPKMLHDYASQLESSGIEVVIAGAGKAAHLAGVLASLTTIPVIGVPIITNDLGGLDSLLSTVQMPRGVPVATVGIGAAKNAGVLATQILALKYPELGEKLKKYKEEMEAAIRGKNE